MALHWVPGPGPPAVPVPVPGPSWLQKLSCLLADVPTLWMSLVSLDHVMVIGDQSPGL